MSGRCLVARVAGALDWAAQPSLSERLRQVIAHGERFIVLELTAVSFCDSSGLNVLLGAHREAEADGALLVLACAPPHLRRISEMTGADQVLRVFLTVADAETAVDG